MIIGYYWLALKLRVLGVFFFPNKTILMMKFWLIWFVYAAWVITFIHLSGNRLNSVHEVCLARRWRAKKCKVVLWLVFMVSNLLQLEVEKMGNSRAHGSFLPTPCCAEVEKVVTQLWEESRGVKKASPATCQLPAPGFQDIELFRLTDTTYK